ncbi:MAG: PASTA domain-containing protein, partial [Acidobacteriota bacterium]
VLFGGSGYLTVRWALSGEELDVPDVIGLSPEEAAERLTRSGLASELAEERFADQQIPTGHVLRQNPPAGTAVKRQRSVRLTLSSGLPQVVVPNTRGDVFTRAQIALLQRDVAVEYIARVHSYEVEEDRVIAQQPDAAEVEAGSSPPARLLVSLGPPPVIYLMPDLVGRPLEQVKAFLQVNGFRLAPVGERKISSVPPGTVVLQEPAPGYQVAEGSVVKLTVSS